MLLVKIILQQKEAYFVNKLRPWTHFIAEHIQTNQTPYSSQRFQWSTNNFKTT